MIRIHCLLLALLLLPFPSQAESSASAEDPTRQYAHQIEFEYDITVLFGSECREIPTPQSFTLLEASAAVSPLLSLLYAPDYTPALEQLEETLRDYPEEFFSLFRTEDTPEGVRFLLVDGFLPTNPLWRYAGFCNYDPPFINIWLQADQLMPVTIHHEIWHALEIRIKASDPDAFSGWEALNPDGFSYLGNEGPEPIEYDPDYFISAYSTVNSREDRACLAAEAFLGDPNGTIRETPVLRLKLEILNDALATVTDFRYPSIQ